MTRGFFVTGTDTGVGKTAVACGLISTLRRRGIRCAPLKPAETGWTGALDDWPPDASALARAAGTPAPRDDVVPYVLPDPLAPSIAAQRAGVHIDLDKLDALHARLSASHELLVVEGAGGLAVPLTEEVDMAGLALRWRLPLVIVARAGLGTLNHTALTVHYAHQRGLHVLGVILNAQSARPDLAEQTNPALIERMARAPLLGILQRLDGVDVERGMTEPMTDAVERCIDLEPILRLLKEVK